MKDLQESEFREFAAAHMHQLRKVAYLTCGDWHAAEDAVSVAMARLFARWSSIDNPGAYARTMVVRAAVDEKRRPWRREFSGAHLPEGSAPDLTAASDERARLWAALSRIPKGQRAVIVLRFYEGLSVDEVAQTLGRSSGTIKSQTSRGLDALRGVLDTETSVFADGHDHGGRS